MEVWEDLELVFVFFRHANRSVLPPIKMTTRPLDLAMNLSKYLSCFAVRAWQLFIAGGEMLWLSEKAGW